MTSTSVIKTQVHQCVKLPSSSRHPHLRSKPPVKCQATSSSPSTISKKKVVIVGGGFAGFGALKHLSEQGFDVTLIDASPNPGGGGLKIEPGVKGFWYQYHNIFKMLQELNLPEWPLTEFETSGFWSPEGLITEAPVFSKQPLRLPAILGQFYHTFNRFYRLSLADRATIIPWLYTAIDIASSPERYEYYDNMSALESFREFGVSQAAYDQFLKPTLLVGLFAPPSELSAAVTIETLYFYALAHQNDFDVAWCKGNISDRIFKPLINHILHCGGKIEGGKFVEELQTDESGNIIGVTARSRETGEIDVYEADAVVMAVSISGMQKLVANNPVLSAREEFRRILSLRCIDAIATKLWLDRRVETKFPANVLAGFEADAGATYFNLTQLQDEYKDQPGTVIAADFYNSTSLMPLSDDEIIKKVQANMALCESQLGEAKITDSAVVKCAKAVTHFFPGSNKYRPSQVTSFTNLFMAGDWVKGLQHGANGLSQERAWVTGLEAANLVIGQLGVGKVAAIIPVEPDELHIAVAREMNSQARKTLQGLGIANNGLY
jgi:uncharacterized protein with NAD-binding domain and iron-sulfur cluster